MKKLRLGVIGCGFWSTFQTAAWMEFDEVDVVALCDKDEQKALSLAKMLDIQNTYTDAREMLAKTALDFVEIITDPDSHASLVKLAADFGVQVICQKPMAPDLDTCQEMVNYCADQGVKFFIHENFRWQQPIRACKEKLESGIIGKPFKGNLKFCSSYPVFENQPLLAELEEFILTDVGTHILDLARFFFGEAETLVCHTHSINPAIRGEDVANVFLQHRSGVTCYAEMSYASRLRDENFPETFILIEGTLGSLYLGANSELSTTTADGTTTEKIALRQFDWAHPEYYVAHESVYHCHRNILEDLLGKSTAESTGTDNLKTLRLVFDSYKSARDHQLIHYRNG